MESKAKTAIILAVIGTIGAAAGGSFMLDFSNTTGDTTISGDTTTNTNITENNNFKGKDDTAALINEGLDIVCALDKIPGVYKAICD